MIIRKVHPDMPTTTVALDLLSRVGSQTKYSLSPFTGYAGTEFKVAHYQDFKSDASFDKFIRMKDNFTFVHQNIHYTYDERERDIQDMSQYEDEDDGDEDYDDDVIIEYDNSGSNEKDKYDPGDASGPKYVRRFEEYHDTARITQFLYTIVRNAITNVNGYVKTKDKIAGTLRGDGSDDEEVNANELAVEDIEDIGELSAQRRSKEALIRSMYRLNMLSQEAGINVVSVLLSYCRFRNTQSSKVAGKPQFLVNNGPVYIAHAQTGDCTVVLTNPNDRALTRVRNVIWPEQYKHNKWADEFYSDCWTFAQCITNLGINARACDATLYTQDWITYYSRRILVNNYDYVCRKVGGYSLNVLKTLQNISLDAAVSESTEMEVDTYTSMLNMIDTIIEMSADEFPPDVYNALRQSSSGDIISTCCDLVTLLNGAEENYKDPANKDPLVAQQVGGVFTASTTSEGFILADGNEDLYKLKIDGLLPKAASLYLSGYAFVHCTGWVVFEPLGDLSVVMNLKTMIHWVCYEEKLDTCPRYVIGPGRKKL